MPRLLRPMSRIHPVRMRKPWWRCGPNWRSTAICGWGRTRGRRMSISEPTRSRSGGGSAALEPIWLQAPKLTPADTERLAMGFLNEHQKEQLYRARATSISPTQRTFGRFRASVVRHRLGIDLVFPHHQHQGADDGRAGPPAEPEAAHAISQRPRPRDRLGRLRQIHHARRARRGGEPDAARPHHHAGGSRSSTSSSRRAATSPSARCTRTPILRRRAARRVCAKIPMSSWSVRCAIWRRSQLAITASETGHLVLGTLHTANAARTLDRVLDVFPIDQREQIRIMVSESLRGIISQQLVPRKDGKGRVLAHGDPHEYAGRRQRHPRGQDLHAPRHHPDRQKAGHEADGRFA